MDGGDGSLEGGDGMVRRTEEAGLWGHIKQRDAEKHDIDTNDVEH